MFKKKKLIEENSILIPKVIGYEVDIAGDMLEDSHIKYKVEDKQVPSLFVDKGCVAKTSPKPGTYIDPNKTLLIYRSNIKLFPFICLGIICLIIIFFILNYGGSSPLLGGYPEISRVNDSWVTSDIVYVNTDATFNRSTVEYYQYCISKTKSDDSCEWTNTYTKSVQISTSGTWYVWFRSISSAGDISYVSNRLKVTIDSDAPTVSNLESLVTNKSIELKVDAKDSLSNIQSYYYSINNSEYVEGTKSYTFTNLNTNSSYDLKVKVVDTVGNYVIYSKTLTTTSTNGSATSTTTAQTIPAISLANIPSIITSGDSISFANELTCTDENNKEITNISSLEIGDHKVTCSIADSSGNEAITTKNISVIVPSGDDESINGNLRVNLDYPGTATDYTYRLKDESVTRTDSNYVWHYYVGPIYIKPEYLDNIYIHYKENGKDIYLSNDNSLNVDIVPNSYSVEYGSTTEVNIMYDSLATNKLYRINDGAWENYEGPFEVSGNTKVDAYASRSIKYYDSLNSNIKSKVDMTSDSIYVQETFPSIGSSGNIDVSINLNDIPDSINEGDSYSIPTYYSFGTHGTGFVHFTSDDKFVYNTNELSAGTHTLKGVITALDGTTKVVTKTIEVNESDSNYSINLNSLLSTITYMSSYTLPSNTTEKGETITNTNSLSIGEHTLTTTNNNISISKTITVTQNNTLSIDLNNIPNEITVGELYSLPSHYSLGNYNLSSIKCRSGNDLYQNTRVMGIGTYQITCTITDTNGNEASAKKTINVVAPIPNIENLN
ncbi:MAG TPA: PASTA domain-containing protein [Bacilli bacterium]|nr:PASTA domain-containing protein [Bacilli bacterium]